MPIRSTVILALLTALYLCVELGFNARLVDALGGHVSTDEVHGLETYGRLLSGAAVALVLLQVLVHVRHSMPVFRRPAGAAFYWLLTLASCGASVGLVYTELEDFTERLVRDSSGAFRRASMTAVLAKAAMVDGTTRLGDLAQDDRMLQQPEGKVFLALFPYLASSMASLEAAFAPDKPGQVRRMVEQRIGGPEACYAHYRRAIQATHEHWQRYQQAAPANLRARLDSSRQAEQDQAWAQYVRDLGRRGWSPYTVPYAAQERVRQQVRKRVPVPADWDPADEDGFREAVARKLQQTAARHLDARSATVNGSAIPFGLEWDRFLAHPAVQDGLRKRLDLPQGVVLQARYASGAAFRRAVFDPVVDRHFRQQWRAYDAPEAQLANGGRFEKEGRDAARAVLVPPLALFCSLLGALTHLTKLACMLSYAALRHAGAATPRIAAAIAAVILCALAAGMSLCYADNAFTRSPAYLRLEQRIDGFAEAPVEAWVTARAMRGVAVGQGLFFPLNETIRARLLFDFQFGFAPKHTKEE